MLVRATARMYVCMYVCMYACMYVQELSNSLLLCAYNRIFDLTALDVAAFERVLGPCMEVMKRNFEHYEEQLMQLFGTTLDITDAQ